MMAVIARSVKQIAQADDELVKRIDKLAGPPTRALARLKLEELVEREERAAQRKRAKR